MSPGAASWTHRNLIRVAVDRVALSELVVGEAALVGARAALQILDAGEGAEEVAPAEGLAATAEDGEDVVAGDPAGGWAGGERVGGDRDAADPAEGVREAGVPEVIEPAGEVGAVGPKGGDLVERVLERVGGGGQGAGSGGAVSVDRADPDLGERVLQAGDLDQIV